MPQKLSFINLKGGVGKTTLAVNIAADLAYYRKLEVLVVDLDPQTNSTVALISPKRYLQLKGEERTLKSMYDAQLDAKKKFDFSDVVIEKAGTVDGLWLLPSDLELLDIDIPLSRLENRITVVKDSLEDFFSDFDYVIFDCPPNMGLLTQNGLFASDYYVVPVQPDFLSTFGLDLVTGRVAKFRERIRKHNPDFNLNYGGLIFSRVRHTLEHEQKMLELRSKKENHPVFKTEIFERTAISEASAKSLPICVSRTGFGWKEVDEMFKQCTLEFLTYFPKEK